MEAPRVFMTEPLSMGLTWVEAAPRVFEHGADAAIAEKVHV